MAFGSLIDVVIFVQLWWGQSLDFEKMCCANSKTDKNEALCLCKEQKRFIKQAIDSRYALATAHVSYTQSLRNIGIALRLYVEAEALIRWGFYANKEI